jgi:hypothetical protein
MYKMVWLSNHSKSGPEIKWQKMAAILNPMTGNRTNFPVFGS